MLTITSDICKIILAIFLPPLGVFLERGCNADFLINILLTVLGYIPVSSGTYTITHKHLTNDISGYHPRSVHHIQVLAGARKHLSRCRDNGLTNNVTSRYPSSCFSANAKTLPTLDSHRHQAISPMLGYT
jgi:uncharacterized membrane protein YqaE (UPF0057 family)